MKTEGLFKQLLLLRILAFFILTSSNVFAQPVDHWETIVSAGQTWKYTIPSAPMPSNWNTTGYVDSGWNTGAGGIGYGDGDDATVIPNCISVYLRMNFTVADTSKLLKAVLNADYDDAFVAYINGVEIARANIGTPGIPVPYNQSAATYREATVFSGGNYEYYILDKTALHAAIQNGNNVLAIQVHNENISSSDLSALFYLSAGISDASVLYSPTPSWFMPPLTFTDSNLPIVSINTLGQTIPDDPRIVVEMGIIYNGPGVRNYLTDPFNNYNGLVNIEIRGSSSATFPKVGYNFETQDASNASINVSLLDLPEENDWILYAPYSEKSLLNNFLTYKMANEMGHYASRCKYVELVINGDYKGVYILMEKIKRDKNRVDIAKLKPTDVSGDDVTGGYILKIDKTTGGADGWTSTYPPYTGAWQNIDFLYHDPKLDELQPQQVTYIQTFMAMAENALASPSYTDPVTGYAAYLDVPSFIDFFIANEVTRNVDGYRLSTFFHKNKDSKGGKLKMGPLWDFNLGLGNANYCSGGLVTGWAYQFNDVCSGDNWQIPFWWNRLMSDTHFITQLRCRWENLRTSVLSTPYLMSRIDSAVAVLDESQQRNFMRWPILGVYVWPNNYVGSTYAEEVNFLKNWLTTRLDWLDNNIPGSCVHTSGMDEMANEPSILVFPNPVVNELYIRADENYIGSTIRLMDAGGKTVLQSVYQWGSYLDMGELPPGMYYLQLQNANGQMVNRKVVKQ